MYHFAKKISLIHLCLYMIFVESVFGGSRDYSVDIPHTHTPHYIKIKWVYRMCPIKCYIKVITRHTK